jgi:hypothetical protein
MCGTLSTKPQNLQNPQLQVVDMRHIANMKMIRFMTNPLFPLRPLPAG